MSYPGTVAIRVGSMATSLPYPVSLHLPPIQGQDQRTEIKTVGPSLDIVVPQDPARHEALGRFMDAWSALESTLAMLLSTISGSDLADAFLIFPKLGAKNAFDLLEGFALRKLHLDSAKKLAAYLDRAGKLNSKRNILVHGHWVLEANVFSRRDEAFLITQFLREIIPTDPEDAKAMANPRNQKQRVRYAFTIKRINGTTRDIESLNREICDFTQTIKFRELPLDEILMKLLLSRPYRVTYS
jgi:hypothetical protein